MTPTRDVPEIVLGAYGCAHLGYAQLGLNRVSSIGGMNQRRIDSMVAHEQIISGMTNAKVAAILQLGDLFHTASPHPDEVSYALATDDVPANAGIIRYHLPGNHDRRGADDVAATSAMHRPLIGGFSVHLGVTGPVGDGPVPGRYAQFPMTAADGTALTLGGKPVILHAVSSQGLPSDDLAARGIVVDPRPVDGAVNVLLAHGIIESMTMIARNAGPGRVIPADWLERGFDLALLGDIHTPQRVPGTTPTWYVGSAVRRGFSDSETERGWSQVTLRADAEPEVVLHPIWQRPQITLPALDCAVLSPVQARDAAAVALDAQTWTDQASADVTGDGGWIINQPFLNATGEHRQVIDTSRAALSARASGALFYAPSYPGSRATATPATGTASASASLGLARSETVADALARLAAVPDSPVARALDGYTPAEQSLIIDGTRRSLEGN